MLETESDESSRLPRFPAESDGRVMDSELFLQQAFDQEARKGFELLFRRYYTVLCSHAVRFVYAREVAEDLVSEVFLTFWKNQAHRHITTSYRAYLFAAVRKRAYSYLQEEFGRNVPLDQLASAGSPVPGEADPEQILQYTELYNRLETGIQTLSPQCRRVFLLSRYEGKKHREIADELRINLKTVEAHLGKALSFLRKVIREGAFLALFLTCP
ncbi:RNA polymerase sigma-70 factor [Larkinella soli]|uniref:RNA polymerase sigma-70 factor n=1 Tax=Larkinella soli TaxID=1770527 RepID=UPI000FFC3C69|nr:RNA polymerase sigma-70 factor [Larkinella soli]